MSRKLIEFDKPPAFDSKGRNGYIITIGLEITCLGGIRKDDDAAESGVVTFHPITSRGDVSEACRVSVALSAVPSVIAALQEILAEKREG